MVITHAMLSAVVTAVVYVKPAADDVRPKSEAATPVTAWLKVAVMVMTLEETETPVAPWDDENVAVGGLYLCNQDSTTRQAPQHNTHTNE